MSVNLRMNLCSHHFSQNTNKKLSRFLSSLSDLQNSGLYGVLFIDNSGSSISMGKKVYPFPSRLSNKAVMLEQRPIRLLKNTVMGTFFSLFRKCLCKLHYIYICPTVYFFSSKFSQDRMVLGHTSSVERFGENFDHKVVTYLIFFVGTH